MPDLEADAGKPGVDPLALLAHHVRLNGLLNRMLVEHESRALAAGREFAALKSTMQRKAEEHAAALTDRDLAHSQHIDLLQADIDRLHQTVRDQAKESLDREAVAHETTRQVRQELDRHVGSTVAAPSITTHNTTEAT